MAIFTIKDNKTNREYNVIARNSNSFDNVWLAQKHWFRAGSKITITNQYGESRTYTKRGKVMENKLQ